MNNFFRFKTVKKLGKVTVLQRKKSLIANSDHSQKIALWLSSSIGHPPHSSASPVELRLRVGPRALSGKKKELR
jgi:hypothetical protein